MDTSTPAAEPYLTLVLPAYNEEDNLRIGLPRALGAFSELGIQFEIVVVDDGSRDRTAETVRAAAQADARVRLVQHAKNAGYGAALRSGFQAARGQLVMFTDADLQFDLKEVDHRECWWHRTRQQHSES